MGRILLTKTKKLEAVWICRVITLGAIMACKMSLLVSLSGCANYSNSELGRKKLSDLPSGYWQPSLSLQVTIIVSGFPSQTRNEDLLLSIEREMADTLAPPEGVEATYSVIPLYARAVEEEYETLQADRHMKISLNCPHLNVKSVRRDKTAAHNIEVRAYCTLYDPGMFPTYSASRMTWERSQSFNSAIKKGYETRGLIGGIFTEIATIHKHNRTLKKEQVYKGQYRAPGIIKTSNICINHRGTLSAEEEGRFMQLIRSVAREINEKCFP